MNETVLLCNEKFKNIDTGVCNVSEILFNKTNKRLEG